MLAVNIAASVVSGILNRTCAKDNIMLLGVELFALPAGFIAQLEE